MTFELPHLTCGRRTARLERVKHTAAATQVSQKPKGSRGEVEQRKGAVYEVSLITAGAVFEHVCLWVGGHHQHSAQTVEHRHRKTAAVARNEVSVQPAT